MLRFPRIRPLLLAIVALWSHGSAIATPRGNVLEWLKEKDAAGSKPYQQVPLQPQWVGTVKVAVLRDPHNLYGDEKPDPMRLNALWRDPQGRVVIARAGEHGYLGTDAAVYQKQLPTLAELKQATKLAELRRWFGPQHGITDGWGDEQESNWTEGWTCFTILEDGRLRWLSVFAHVKGPRKDQGVTGEIDTLTVHEGFLRVADPTSESEKLTYPSAEELEAAEEAARASERAKIPEPLRSLVSARQKQGDSDLRAYTDAINAIRRDPKPGLFAQMAERIDDGTCEMQGMVEAILCDDGIPHYGAPWDLKKKHLALRQAVAATDHVTTRYGLEKWSELLLQALGGGHLQPKREDGGLWIDMKVEVEGSSKSMSVGGGTITDENLAEAKRAIRAELVSKFPILKPE